MNKLQENKLSMYILVSEECNKFKSEWKKMKSFTQAISGFNNIIEDIVDTRQKQELNSTGTTKKRKKLQVVLIDIAEQFISALKVCAMIQNDDELFSAINYTRTSLNLSRDTILRDKCLLVYNKALNTQEQLAEYGIDPEMISEFNTILQNYTASLSVSKQAINKRKLATSTLHELFKEGDNILNNKLDNLIKLFRLRAPEFYATYKNSRKIIDRGTRHKSISIIEMNNAA